MFMISVRKVNGRKEQWAARTERMDSGVVIEVMMPKRMRVSIDGSTLGKRSSSSSWATKFSARWLLQETKTIISRTCWVNRENPWM